MAWLGWNLSIPSISVETRWGVPRYDPAKESETYLMSGEQLSPVAHRSAWVSRTGSEKQFYPRIEGSFQKIMRYGSSPNNYYWVVTDKNGTKYYYGGINGVDENAVLRRKQGAETNAPIAHWALVKIEDVSGNFVKYDYVIQKHKGVSDPNAAEGYQIYIKKITYTGFNGEAGKYSVEFIRDREKGESQRIDVSIMANYGFKQVTADLLREIKIKYNNEIIRSYELKYKTGAFNKTLLDSIKEYDANGEFFTAHGFEYYDDVRNSSDEYVPFKAEQDLEVVEDEISGDGAMSWASVNATGGSKSKSWGLGSYVGIGWDQIVTSKGNSAGIDYDYTDGKSEGLMTLVDIDGDGLPDRVFIKDGVIKYRKKLPGNQGFSSDDPIVVGGSVNSFQYSKSKTNKFGVGVYALSSYIGGSLSLTTTKTSIYFTDANADGLIDIVKDGKVYFNKLVDGVPTFNNSSAGTPNELLSVGEISPSLNFNTYTEEEVDKLKQTNPLHDIVKMWKAQFSGIIKITGALKLIPNPDSEATLADGVKVSIQKNDEIIWEQTISSDNYDEIIPDNNNVGHITINRGDKLYFRVHSIDNGFDDVVHWNPEITYLDKDEHLLDANNLPYFKYNAKDDYLLSNNMMYSAPISGVINIESVFEKPQLSDDIDVYIIRLHSSGIDTLWHSDYLWPNTASENINLTDITVDKDDQLVFVVYSRSM